MDLQCTKDLSQHVDGELLPWELSEDATGEGDRGVEMGSALAPSVDTQHYTNAMTLSAKATIKRFREDLPPAPTDGLVVSILASTQDNLGYDTIAEHKDDECSNELGEGVLQAQSDSRPKELRIRFIKSGSSR